MLFAEQVVTSALTNSQKLSLLAQDLRKVKPVTITIWMDQKLAKHYS